MVYMCCSDVDHEDLLYLAVFFERWMVRLRCLMIGCLCSHQSDLRSKKEDLRREKETLQRQIDMMREQGLMDTSTLTDTHHVVHTFDLDSLPSDGTGRSVPGHRRSASADFNHGAPASQTEMDMLSLEARGMPRRPRHSVSNPQSHSAAAGGGKQNIPMHLMSTRNEQRLGGANMQKLPMKLSSGVAGSSSSSAAAAHHRQQQQQQHPRTASLSSLGARQGGASPASVTPTPQQAQGMITRNQNSRSTPSNLALVMKLAEPTGRGRGAAAHQAHAGGGAGGSARGGTGSASAVPKPASEGSPDRVIYF